MPTVFGVGFGFQAGGSAAGLALFAGVAALSAVGVVVFDPHTLVVAACAPRRAAYVVAAGLAFATADAVATALSFGAA